MRAENRLNNASDYLNGFNDVREHRSVCETITGLLKIISYALIIPPIIMGILYLKGRIVCDLQDELDGQVDQIFAQTFQKNSPQRINEYLINKLINLEMYDDIDLEKKRFETGFKLLTFESQKEFFKMALEADRMALALQWIPNDIKELNFVSGPKNPISDSETNRHSIKLFLEELPRFVRLEKIELDLRGVGFYGPSVDKNVQFMTQGSGRFAFIAEDDRRTFIMNGAEYSHYNETFQIVETVVAMRTLIQQQPNLIWNFRFMDLTMYGVGTESQGTNGMWSFTNNLSAYFNHSN
jgi:hypothetical protein